MHARSPVSGPSQCPDSSPPTSTLWHRRTLALGLALATSMALAAPDTAPPRLETLGTPDSTSASSVKASQRARADAATPDALPTSDARTATPAADRGTSRRERVDEGQPAEGEPQVRRIVVEDDGARVDELRVRGVTRRIQVQPKTGGAAPYEILPPDASQRVDDGWPATRGASGQRVWNVLNF